MTTITVVTNPAAIGAEWQDGDTRHSLTVLRGSSTVRFGMKVSDVARWAEVTVERPERFGAIPTDAKTMRAFAEAFVGAADAS